MSIPGPIVDVAYDKQTRILDVTFHGGQSLRFFGVPASKVEMLGDLNRRDAYFYEHIAGGLFWIDRSRAE